jgi:hypothetical protein
MAAFSSARHTAGWMRGRTCASRRVSVQVEPGDQQHEPERDGPAGHVADHGAAHHQPRLQDRHEGAGQHPEQQRDPGEQDRRPHGRLVGQQQADSGRQRDHHDGEQ